MRATMGPPPPNRHHRAQRTERNGRDSVSDDEGLVDVPTTEEWRRLVTNFEAIRDRHLRELFAEDPERGSSMTVTAGDLTLDYSKHRATARPWPP